MLARCMRQKDGIRDFKLGICRSELHYGMVNRALKHMNNWLSSVRLKVWAKKKNLVGDEDLCHMSVYI